MRAWESPEVPDLAGTGPLPLVHDTATDALRHVGGGPTGAGHEARLYVCGITPYDATHLGHAATYLAFDTLQRLWLDAGLAVTYVQNTTDVDDPLLERARATGVDWRELAASETELFRTDMQALRMLPPTHYVAVTEVVDEIADAVAALLASGSAYRLGDDVYFDSAAASATTAAGVWQLGDESRYDRDTMLALSAERGGDPDRDGKHDPLDPLLWRGARADEPSWPSVVGEGRPGWHIECSVIAARSAGLPLDVNGGGHDLVFPHHEFSAGHTAALDGSRLSGAYVHAGLVAYEGEKMSKSLGNLVLVSRLREAGHDPRAIRLALLAHHYRGDWEWTDAALDAAEARLAAWSLRATDAAPADAGVATLRTVLARDLDTPGALALVDALPMTEGLVTAIDALLGIRL